MTAPVVQTQNQDRKVVMAVVYVLGAVALLGLSIIGALLIVAQIRDKAVETASIAVVSGLVGTAVGAVGSLLASTRTAEANPVVPQVPVAPNPADILPIAPPQP